MIEESLFTAGAVEVTLSHAVPRAPGKYSSQQMTWVKRSCVDMYPY